MPVWNAVHFAAELTEMAQSAPDLASLRRDVLERVANLVGCETYYWGEVPGAPEKDPIYESAHPGARPSLDRFASARGRYDVPRALQAVHAKGGVASDDEFFTRADRDRLPLFAEVLRPAGIRTYLACCVDFRGIPMSIITLSRHSRGARFATRERDAVRAVKGAIGLVEAAFRADLLAPPPTEERLRARYGLSPREAQIAVLLGRGLQNKEVAALLGTSAHTVRKQTVRIFQKLRVPGRVHLAAKLLRDY
jgi:DNA-binding CsgD family transcriptional regulator